jgi:hypothetical protein
MECMNKRLKTSNAHASLTLGDLILAVSSSSRNSRETAAAVTDLLRSGRACLSNRRCKLRVAA